MLSFSFSPLSSADLAVSGLADFSATNVEFAAKSDAGRAWLAARTGFNYADAIASANVRKSAVDGWLKDAFAAGLGVAR